MIPAHQTAKSLSQMLAQAVQQGTGDYVSIGEVIAAIKTQALALMLILFALPNILPSIPGTSAITGMPLLLLTLQMAIGQGIWLPKIIANRAVPRSGMLALLARARPYFDRVEHMLRPRLAWASSAVAHRLLGALMGVLSLVIMLPIPLANALPALAILIIAVGLAERDGFFILGGLVVAASALAVLVTFYNTLITMALAQIMPWF